MIRPDKINKINTETASVPGNRVERSVTNRPIVEATPILYFELWRRSTESGILSHISWLSRSDPGSLG